MRTDLHNSSGFATAGGAGLQQDAIGNFSGTAEALGVGEAVVAPEAADCLAFALDEGERRMGRAEAVWKPKSFGYCFTGFFGALCAYWFFYVPSPGKAVAVLAVVAAVMTFREDMRGIEKGLFALLLFALLAVELRAMDRDGEERRQQFTELIAQARLAIGRQEALAKQTVNTMTGGDSFCVLQFSRDGFLMTFLVKGDAPLYDVRAVIMNQSDLKRVFQKKLTTYEDMASIQLPFDIGNFGAETAIVRKNVIKLPDSGDGGFTIHFNGRNGFWNQYMLVHKSKDGWLSANRVARQHGREEHQIFEQIDPAFPQPVDWRPS